MNNFVELIKNNVNISDLNNAVEYTWQGMSTIFIVMAAIAIIVFFSAKVSGRKK